MTSRDTIDTQEVTKFAQQANYWWDKSGPFKTLHDINPCRVAYIERMQSLPAQRILDLGCGGGILSEALAQQGACVTGIDVESGSINTAQQHAKQQSLDIQYLCQPIEQFHGEPFNSIVCMEMLEHVPNPQRIITTAAGLLLPGGYLFLSTINRTLKAYTMVIVAAEYLLNLLPRQTHDFDKFIKPSELAAMARNAGLEVVDISGMDYRPTNGIASLSDSVAVNYFLTARKPKPQHL